MNKSASGVVEDSHTRSLSGPANVISFFMGALRNARPSPFASKLALASCALRASFGWNSEMADVEAAITALTKLRQRKTTLEAA